VPHEAKAYLTIGQSSDRYIVCGTFEDKEWKALLDFVQYANDLVSIQLIRDGGPATLNLSNNAESGMSYSVELPPEDQLLALLHRIRPFILQKEPTNFYQVCKYLSRRFADAPFRDFLKSLGEHYSGKRMQDIVRVQSNQVLINSEETLMKWLNAHEYHKDQGKQDELKSLHQVMPLEASRAFFVMMLNEKVKAISILANFINVMAGEQETFGCTFN